MAARHPTRRLHLLLQLAEAVDALIHEAVHNTGEEGGSPGMSGEPDGNGAEAQSSTPRAAAPSNGTEAPPQSSTPHAAAPSNGTVAPPQSGAPEEATAGPSSGPEPKKTDPEAAEVAESAEPNEESPVAGHRPLKRQRTTADDPPSQGSTGSTQPWG